MQKLGAKFVFERGIADDGRLDIYDAGIALNGIARGLAITTHAFINGEVKTHAESVRGAEIYLLPTRHGSFLIEASIWLTETVVAGVFYEFLRHNFMEAVGRGEPEENLAANLQKRIEPTIGELPEALESALHDMHRPIRHRREMTLKVTRPRGEVLTQFDAATADYLLPHVMPIDEPIVGSVTRYNTNSRWGRIYDRRLQRTVSFWLGDKVNEYQRSLVTWSLHETNLMRDGTLHMSGTAVVSPNEQVKRYTISHVAMPREP